MVHTSHEAVVLRKSQTWCLPMCSVDVVASALAAGRLRLLCRRLAANRGHEPGVSECGQVDTREEASYSIFHALDDFR